MPEPCKSCARPILWAVTVNERPIPLDIDPTPHGDMVLERGVARRARESDPPGPRFTTHFVTCPNAAKHRRKRAPAMGQQQLFE